MYDQKLNIVVIGAHADDCELYAGGSVLQFLKKGHKVTFVVMTDGGAGHHQLSKEDIVKRRYLETRKVALRLGIEYIVLNNPDGWLEATIENRKNLITLLRKIKPDLIIT
ncbi:MAG: PIG-L family deacetylase, partial [Phycisphaerales bacterium]